MEYIFLFIFLSKQVFWLGHWFPKLVSIFLDGGDKEVVRFDRIETHGVWIWVDGYIYPMRGEKMMKRQRQWRQWKMACGFKTTWKTFDRFSIFSINATFREINLCALFKARNLQLKKTKFDRVTCLLNKLEWDNTLRIQVCPKKGIAPIILF